MATALSPDGASMTGLEVYRSLFMAYPDALLVVDGQGQIVLANPQAAQLLGYPQAELVGLPVDVLVPDAIRPRHAAYRQGYSVKPRARPMGTQMDLVARRRDGSEVMVEIALSPLRDQGLPFVVAAVRGIDSYPRVREAQRRARYSECLAQMARLAVDEPELETMLQRLPLAVAEIVNADSAALLQLALDQTEFRIVGGYQLMPGESLGARVANTPDEPAGFVVRSAQPLHIADISQDSRFAAAPNTAAPALRASLTLPLLDRGQVLGVLSLRFRQLHTFAADEMQFVDSMACLLAARLQHAQSEEALQHVQRLETVGQLTGGIAHDFNNLLTIIQGNLQVLEDRPAIQQDSSAAACLAAAMRAGQRSAELTGKLLAFSRRQALRPRAVDVAALLHDVAGMLRRTLGSGIDVQVTTTPLQCMADPAQLESALLNLAVNARDAMSGGGVLRLGCRPLLEVSPDLASELSAGLGKGWHYALIEVSDSGTGMSAEVMKRAFEPFFTTKELGRGTGLGLSSVYGFAKQSLGTVRLRTTVGKGTTVALLLPGAQAAQVTAAGAARADQAVPTNDDAVASADAAAPLPLGLQVLLVEDQDEVRRTLSQTLRGLGCQVSEAADAEAALAWLASNATPQLLLSDVALGPGMQGDALARLAQARWPGMARLLMSGYVRDAGATGQPASADELLAKPFDRSILASAMKRALAAVPVSAEPPQPPAD